MSTRSLYITTVAIWGSSWFAITLQLGIVHPIWSVAYRFVLAAVILMTYCIATHRRLRFPWQDHGFLAIQGFFLFSLNYILFYFVIQHLTSGVVAVTFSTIVFLNMLNGALIFRAPVSARVVAGACLGLLGISLVFWPELRALDASSGALSSLALAVLATWVASLGNMAAVRNQRHSLPVLQSNAFGMAYGACFTTMAAVTIGGKPEFDWSIAYVGSLLYLAVFATIIAFGAYLSLLGRIGADRAAYASVLFPIVALALSTLFEEYHWSIAALLGVATVLAGNLLILTGGTRARPLAAVKEDTSP
jgi:drug/metabolite transporter (DMT)-like permease